MTAGKTRSPREPGAAGPASLLRPQHDVWALWNASGPGAFVRGGPGGRGGRGVPLRAQAVPVHPRPSAPDLQRRDTVRDRHRRRRMLPIKGGGGCVWACVRVCAEKHSTMTQTVKLWSERSLFWIECHKSILTWNDKCNVKKYKVVFFLKSIIQKDGWIIQNEFMEI